MKTTVLIKFEIEGRAKSESDLYAAATEVIDNILDAGTFQDEVNGSADDTSGPLTVTSALIFTQPSVPPLAGKTEPKIFTLHCDTGTKSVVRQIVKVAATTKEEAMVHAQTEYGPFLAIGGHSEWSHSEIRPARSMMAESFRVPREPSKRPKRKV